MECPNDLAQHWPSAVARYDLFCIRLAQSTKRHKKYRSRVRAGDRGSDPSV
jgi:hypothetical protein